MLCLLRDDVENVISDKDFRKRERKWRVQGANDGANDLNGTKALS